MKQVPEEVLEYIRSQRVGVFAIEMLDGAPHAAALHYAHSEDPLAFCFTTERTYRKSQALLGRGVSRASLVIGFDEDRMKSLQVDGEARLVKPGAEQEAFEKIYLKKFPNRNIQTGDPNSLTFIFTPTWWRFTDWTGPKGKTVVSSENS